MPVVEPAGCEPIRAPAMPPPRGGLHSAADGFCRPWAPGNLDVRGQPAETKAVGLAAEFIVVVVLPTALGFGAIGAVRVLRWAGQRRAHSPPLVPAALRRGAAPLRPAPGHGERPGTPPPLPPPRAGPSAVPGPASRLVNL